MSGAIGKHCSKQSNAPNLRLAPEVERRGAQPIPKASLASLRQKLGKAGGGASAGNGSSAQDTAMQENILRKHFQKTRVFASKPQAQQWNISQVVWSRVRAECVHEDKCSVAACKANIQGIGWTSIMLENMSRKNISQKKIHMFGVARIRRCDASSL